LLSLAAFLAFAQISSPSTLVIGAKDWQLVREHSGPNNYYSAMSEGGVSFIRSKYVPPSKTSVVGWKTPEADRQRVKKVSWTWRVQKFPTDGDECVSSKADSAAVVYVTWKRFVRYYTLKYVWSSVGTKGKICDSKRNPFVAQDTVIVESGGPPGTWKSVGIDLASEYRNHFEGGNAKADVPDFIGIGLMSDGDQTQSESSSDFGDFTITR
jgi:hypothetical protein